MATEGGYEPEDLPLPFPPGTGSELVKLQTDQEIFPIFQEEPSTWEVPTLQRHLMRCLHVNTPYMVVVDITVMSSKRTVQREAYDCMDCNPLRSSVHRILQARILESAALSFSWRLSLGRDWTRVSCIRGRFFTTELPGKPPSIGYFFLLCFGNLSSTHLSRHTQKSSPLYTLILQPAGLLPLWHICTHVWRRMYWSWGSLYDFLLQPRFPPHH